MSFVDATLNDVLLRTVVLSIAAFGITMILTPVYTFVAYRYKFWKRQRSTSTLGEKLEVFTKLHANKFTRNIPTMAGIIGVVSITVITLCFNWDRAGTWLPLAGLLGGAAVGLAETMWNAYGEFLWRDFVIYSALVLLLVVFRREKAIP